MSALRTKEIDPKRIDTLFGSGTVTGYEYFYTSKRFRVELDNNPFCFSPVYLFENDIISDRLSPRNK